ncbi:MAG TPA: protein kinase, partial [Polyangiaceae bacterium]
IRSAARAPESARRMRGEYSLKERLGTLLGVCEAIHFAHERGVIHRDLKPDNVMLGRFREVYVMDWGLARVTGGAIDMAHAEDAPENAASAFDLGQRDTEAIGVSATMVARSTKESEPDSMATRHGDVMGTPQYMPPEQALGLIDKVGPAADQYALGVMLQELATLKPARSHTSTQQAFAEALQNLLAKTPDVDGQSVHPALAAIVLRATQKEPEERYQSVRAMADDIRRFVRDEPVSVYQEGLARGIVRAAARRPVLAMTILSICGFLTSVAVVGGVIHDARKTEHQARVLDNTRRVLIAVGNRAHVIDAELSERAASVKSVAAATVELLDRGDRKVSVPEVPRLVPSAQYGGAPVSFEGMVVFWPGKQEGAAAPANANKIDRLERWLREALVDALPPAERDAPAAAQDAALKSGHSGLLRAFIGLEDGTFAQFPAREVLADPRARPWYRMAAREPNLHWTRPVVDATKRTVRISALMGMRASGQFLGVAGCDIRVSALAPKLKVDLPGFRRAYLVTEKAEIAVSESLEQEVLTKVTDPDADLVLPSVDDAALADRIRRGEAGGYVESKDRLLVFARLVSSPWTYVAELDRSAYRDH